MKPTLRAVIFDYGNTLVEMDPALHSKRTDYADVVAVPGAERMAAHLERRGFLSRENGVVFIDRFLRTREQNRLRADATGDEIPATVSLREALRGLAPREPSPDDLREALEHFFAPEEELLQEIPGAGATLHALAERGLRLALLSNATDEAYIGRVLTRMGWRSRFDPRVVSSAIGVRKPRPEAFHAVLAAWRFEPTEVAIVGDSLRHDIEGGNRVGLWTVHFTRIPNPLDPEYKDRVQPRASAGSHEDLARLLLDGCPPC